MKYKYRFTYKNSASEWSDDTYPTKTLAFLHAVEILEGSAGLFDDIISIVVLPVDVINGNRKFTD